MIVFKIKDKNNNELFCCSGKEIDTVYNGVYCEGDKIEISKTATEYLSIKLDDTLTESIIFAPSSTFEFKIPWNDFKRGYDKEAFSGNSHRIIIYEPSDEVKYGTRIISLNSHDKRGQKKY